MIDLPRPVTVKWFHMIKEEGKKYVHNEAPKDLILNQRVYIMNLTIGS